MLLTSLDLIDDNLVRDLCLEYALLVPVVFLICAVGGGGDIPISEDGFIGDRRCMRCYIRTKSCYAGVSYSNSADHY